MDNYLQILAENPISPEMAEYVANVKHPPTKRMDLLWRSFSQRERDVVTISYLHCEGLFNG